MAVKLVEVPCSSASTRSTSDPAAACMTARFVATVDLPVPPFVPPTTVIISTSRRRRIARAAGLGSPRGGLATTLARTDTSRVPGGPAAKGCNDDGGRTTLPGCLPRRADDLPRQRRSRPRRPAPMHRFPDRRRLERYLHPRQLLRAVRPRG